MSRSIEQQAADALLDIGISLPLFRFRIPFVGERTVRITLRRPYLGTHMRIARIYLKMGVSAKQIEAFSTDEEMTFINEHGVELSQILALAVCRGKLSGLIIAPIVAWIIRWRVDRLYLLEAQRRFLNLRSSRDFMSIIVLAEKTNPFRPETSHATPTTGRISVKKGS